MCTNTDKQNAGQGAITYDRHYDYEISLISRVEILHQNISYLR